MKKRFLALCMIAAMAVGTLVGCGSGEDNAQNETKEKVLNVGVTSLPETVEPSENSDAMVKIVNALFERLYLVDSKGNVTYFLAESCEASADAMTYTLKLKDNATCILRCCV